jgi:putative transposase
LTICCWQRWPLLASNDTAAFVRDHLLQSAERLSVEICAYTVMPDHVHVLACAARSAAWDLMRRWKQSTGFQWRQAGHGCALWQRGFHDRVLRLDEDPSQVSEYIVINPVRARLVDRSQDYQFSAAPRYGFPL